MTVDEVRIHLDQIREHGNDDERAHGQEDALWRAVLEAIAGGAPDAAELAREALRSTEIEFSRWCA